MSVISIIVPVYKTEKYVHRCIDSILAQTFTDFECIVIDDGSPDNCPAICDEYAAKDSRIIVIHQKNKGVSAARNAGLDRARGEWIGFVDSDDWCDPGMFAFLLENAEKHHVDISVCGLRSINEKNEIKYPIKGHSKFIINNNLIQEYYLKDYFMPFSFNKLVNKRLFSWNNEVLRYDETIKYAEDALMFFYLFKRSQRVYFSSQPYYNYYKHPESATMLYASGVSTDLMNTGFNVITKMLQIETNNKSRRRLLLAREGRFAAFSCLMYIESNGFNYDNNYKLLKNIVKKNLKYILVFSNIKVKISGFLVFLPFIYYLYCKLRRAKF
jgi:glycosyltransferase involved in cell wall biosynthesis